MTRFLYPNHCSCLHVVCLDLQFGKAKEREGQIRSSYARGVESVAPISYRAVRKRGRTKKLLPALYGDMLPAKSGLTCLSRR